MLSSVCKDAVVGVVPYIAATLVRPVVMVGIGEFIRPRFIIIQDVIEVNVERLVFAVEA